MSSALPNRSFYLLVSRDLANRVTANKLCPSLSIRLHKDRQHRHRQENCNREQQGSEQAQENLDEGDARKHIGNLFRTRSFAQSEKNESALVSRLLSVLGICGSMAV
jgi:hypothetical protein